MEVFAAPGFIAGVKAGTRSAVLAPRERTSAAGADEPSLAQRKLKLVAGAGIAPATSSLWGLCATVTLPRGHTYRHIIAEGFGLSKKRKNDKNNHDARLAEASAKQARVAQRQSEAFIRPRLWVRIPPLAQIHEQHIRDRPRFRTAGPDREGPRRAFGAQKRE